MSDLIKDMEDLYMQYGLMQENFGHKKLAHRINLLEEEFKETKHAFWQGDPEELVDGLIDIIVVAIGTLELADVNVEKAWEEVLKANQKKKRGTKSTRPGTGGFDLVKPKRWKAPSHMDNHGVLDEIL